METTTPYLSIKSNANLVILEDGSVRTIPLDCRAEWTVGRSAPGNEPDIALNSKIVSRQHGKLTNINGQWFFVDNGKANGTYYNSNKIVAGSDGTISPVALSNGDVLRIDSNNLMNPDSRGVWMMFSTVSHGNVWNTVRLEKAETVFGRSEENCDVVVPLSFVSARHFAIKKYADGTYSASVGNYTFAPVETGDTKSVPEGFGSVMSYMGWQSITSPSSMQYKLKQEAMGFDSDGIGKVGDRFAIAVKPYYGLTGDLLDVKYKDGTVLKGIVADVKGSENEPGKGQSKYINMESNKRQLQMGVTDRVHADGSVVEWVVDKYNSGNFTDLVINLEKTLDFKGAMCVIQKAKGNITIQSANPGTQVTIKNITSNIRAF